MKTYKGDAPCPGCGKTGREKERYCKDGLCWDCKRLLGLGKEISEIRANQTDKITEVSIYMTGLQYLSSSETHDCIAAFREFLTSISDKEKSDNCQSRYIGHYDHSDSKNIRGIKMTPESADHLESFVMALNQYSKAVYDDGVKHGSNLLMRLNEGELTPDAFIKRVNGDRSF
jgi:hypothetical protein